MWASLQCCRVHILRAIEGWGSFEHPHGRRGISRRLKPSRTSECHRARKPQYKKRRNPQKSSKSDIEVGRSCNSNLSRGCSREREEKPNRLEGKTEGKTVLTGSTMESSLYFDGGEPRSDCTMPATDLFFRGKELPEDKSSRVESDKRKEQGLFGAPRKKRVESRTIPRD